MASSPEDEFGGKVILPTSALEEITQFEDASPVFHMHDPASRLAQRAHATMIFEISAQSGKRSFCGVLEFTGQEGTIQVPKWMMQNLGLEQGVLVQVRRVALPKGDFLQLQPESADFFLLPDPKAALEWVLPRFVALTTNDSIVVVFQDVQYVLHVLSVKPGRAISITDSDINLDFAPPRVGTVPAAKTPPPTAAAPVKPAAKAAPAPVGVATGALAPTADQVEGKDFKVCDNCHRNVPIATHTMHSLTCARMNWYCKECNTAVPKDQRQAHMDQVHKLVTCECGAPMEARFLERHKAEDCPSRIVQCMYCEMKLPMGKRAEHEVKCGDLTESCSNCKQYIQKRCAYSTPLLADPRSPPVPSASEPPAELYKGGGGSGGGRRASAVLGAEAAAAVADADGPGPVLLREVRRAVPALRRPPGAPLHHPLRGDRHRHGRLPRRPGPGRRPGHHPGSGPDRLRLACHSGGEATASVSPPPPLYMRPVK